MIPRANIGAVEVQGPVIIESYDTTIAVPPGCRVRADAIGNIIIDIEEANV